MKAKAIAIRDREHGIKEQFDGAVHAGFLVPRSCNSNNIES